MQRQLMLAIVLILGAGLAHAGGERYHWGMPVQANVGFTIDGRPGYIAIGSSHYYPPVQVRHVVHHYPRYGYGKPHHRHGYHHPGKGHHKGHYKNAYKGHGGHHRQGRDYRDRFDHHDRQPVPRRRY